MKKALLIIFVLLFIFAQSVFAFELDVPDKTFRLNITNSTTVPVILTSPVGEKVTVYLLNPPTWMGIDQYSVTVPANKPVILTLSVQPGEDITPGLYKATIIGESGTITKQADVFFSISGKKRGIEIQEIIISGNFEPRGNINVVIRPKNLGDKAMINVEFNYELTSPSGTIESGTEMLDLGVDEEIELVKSFKLDDLAESGAYTFYATIKSSDGKILNQAQESLTVLKMHKIIQTSKDNSQGLRTEKTIRIYNAGNDVARDILIREPISNLQSVFYSGTEPSERSDNIFIWRIDVAPGETKIISYAVDYTYPLLLVFAFLFIMLFLFFKLRVVRIKKFIMQEKFITEGENFTICIEVHNFTGRTINRINVTDLVPPLFAMKDTIGPKPAKKKTESGVELSWEISNFKSGDQRIFTYRLVPQIGVHGKIRLPSARAHYKNKRGPIERISGYAVIGVDAEMEAKKKMRRLTEKQRQKRRFMMGLPTKKKKR